jgi:hypothetical protein
LIMIQLKTGMKTRKVCRCRIVECARGDQMVGTVFH